MKIAVTLAAPSDETASAVTSEESTPPESPTTTRSNPTLRTPSAMKPRSSPATKPESIASASAAESIGLCVVDIVSFVAEQRIGDPCPAQRAALEGVEQHRVLRARHRADHGAERSDHARSAPEADAILEPGSVAVDDVRGEQLRIGSGHDVVASRRAE